MESLGNILKRSIPTSRQLRTNNSVESPLASPLTEEQPKCPVCRGTEWVSRRIGDSTSHESVRCQCIKARDAEDKKKRLIKWANLPNNNDPRTFDNFELLPGTEAAFSAAKEFPYSGHMVESEDDPIDDFTGTDHHILVITGRNGCGKSHLLEAIGRRLLAEQTQIRYEYVPTLLDGLRAAYDDDAEVRFPQKWASIMRTSGLLLDDLGAEKGSDWAREKLTALVDERYRTGAAYCEYLVVATNLNFEQMGEQLGYRIADRLFDEHTGKVKVVNMTANSYRTGKAWGMPRRR